ncbi:hypothetical protein Cthiooxydans_26590 [Comamonas thiooxydans]|nr:nuclear transport factor 2 family protein [Comamonas thiooxydans]BDB70247.1 hypothetical protein Cthiooxydans_26590 [Comamonas thiooxydans]
MTLQDISDKVEINELLARYCHALDEKDWHSFQAIFLPDVILDFTAFGGPKGSPAELQEFFCTNPWQPGLDTAHSLYRQN